MNEQINIQAAKHKNIKYLSCSYNRSILPGGNTKPSITIIFRNSIISQNLQLGTIRRQRISERVEKRTNAKIRTYHIITEARRWSGRVKKIATDSTASQEATRDFLDPSESLKSTKLKYCPCLKPVDSRGRATGGYNSHFPSILCSGYPLPFERLTGVLLKPESIFCADFSLHPTYTLTLGIHNTYVGTK